MRPRLLALPGNEALADALAAALDAEPGGVTVRSFPDEESYVRLEGDVAGRTLVLVCTLDRPNAKAVPLLLLAATARDLGAARIGLVAPYLPYLRQDDRFLPGEGITSAYFAGVLSGAFDWLVTVDPHLHRYRSLADLYRIPAHGVQAAPAIAAWLRTHVPDAVVIGPDVESAQWVTALAQQVGVPHLVLDKVRRGDRAVEVSFPADAPLANKTPVLLDDIISTGRTMGAAIARLREAGARAPVCVGVHAVFAPDAYDELVAAGAASVVTCNTIPHPSNAIDISGALAGVVRKVLDG
jgi:ribose-phosphate pyrophosphokinase